LYDGYEDLAKVGGEEVEEKFDEDYVQDLTCMMTLRMQQRLEVRRLRKRLGEDCLLYHLYADYDDPAKVGGE
jgi:hypothetical protein